ncbi:MAG: amino acid decarboxylase, partial [Lachnospiraceae bacterium]|nr:amino acid decarboxylase [Lachnospiraceae bacterium]
ILIHEGISDLEKASDKIAGIVVTSPTYEGISSGIRRIAESVHQYGIPLIVDEAHGAHFGIHPAYPESAVSQGADLVIQSVHKTLPAPTQTALLHKNGRLVDSRKLRKYLSIYQSSSPSYLLMAGIDEAVFTVSREGEKKLDDLLHFRGKISNEIEKCRHIRLCQDTEPGRLVISTKGTSMSGQKLYDILREKYHLQMEMAAGTYVIAILSMMDTEEGINRLISALWDIDKVLCDKQGENLPVPYPDRVPLKAVELWRAYQAVSEEIDFIQSKNRIAAEFVNLYPPGVPILVPGEIINSDVIDLIRSYLENGYTVQGIENQKIRTLIKK